MSVIVRVEEQELMAQIKIHHYKLKEFFTCENTCHVIKFPILTSMRNNYVITLVLSVSQRACLLIQIVEVALWTVCVWCVNSCHILLA